jgi:hypothetical protein
MNSFWFPEYHEISISVSRFRRSCIMTSNRLIENFMAVPSKRMIFSLRAAREELWYMYEFPEILLHHFLKILVILLKLWKNMILFVVFLMTLLVALNKELPVNVEWSGHGLIWGSMWVRAWRDWGRIIENLWRQSVSGPRFEPWTCRIRSTFGVFELHVGVSWSRHSRFCWYECSFIRVKPVVSELLDNTDAIHNRLINVTGGIVH